MGWRRRHQALHSLQVLEQGFVLATITKQQTTSVGKGHKKFSFPLLKPSGAYKNWLVGMVGSTSSPLSSSWHLTERGGTRGVTLRDRNATGMGGWQTPPPLCITPAPASTSSHFLSEPELLYEVPVPPGTPAPARAPSVSP